MTSNEPCVGMTFSRAVYISDYCDLIDGIANSSIVPSFAIRIQPEGLQVTGSPDDLRYLPPHRGLDILPNGVHPVFELDLSPVDSSQPVEIYRISIHGNVKDYSVAFKHSEMEVTNRPVSQ